MVRASVWLGMLLLAPVAGFCHHSVASWFDSSQVKELEGELTELKWQNPHIVFTLKVMGEDGRETLWDMESLSLSGVTRTGLTPDLLVVGQTLKVAGNPSRRNLNNVFVRNILLPSGQEIVLGQQARWTADSSLRGSEVLTEREGDTSAPAQGIFRGLEHGLRHVDDLSGEHHTELRLQRLSPDAHCKKSPRRVRYIRGRSDSQLRAEGHAAPHGAAVPDGIRARRRRIVLRLEEYDSRRVIHMDAAAASAAARQPASLLGYSVGRWEGRALVVTTTRVNFGHFDSVGIPLSEAAEIVERFTPSEDGARLDYTLTVTDAATFTRPVETSKHWIWLPGISVGRYACSPR